MRPKGNDTFNLKFSDEFWYVIGVLFGDGCAYSYKIYKKYHHYVIQLNCKDKEFADEFFRCCKSIGLNPHPQIKKSESCKQGFYYRVSCYSKFFYDWYLELRKNYKNSLSNLSDEFKTAFIRGFFDSEGCFTNFKDCHFSNTKMEIINFIKGLLLSLGFNSSIYNSNGGFCNNYHLQLLGGRTKIKEFLTLVQPTSEERLGNLIVKNIIKQGV